MFLLLSVMVVCLVPNVRMRTVTTDCDKDGGECLYANECAQTLSPSSTGGQCTRGKVCCRRDNDPSRSSSVSTDKGSHSRTQVKSMYLRPDGNTISPYALYPNMKYSVEQSSGGENVETRIVNVEILNNTLANPTTTTVMSSKTTTIETTEGDNIVFPEKSEEEEDDRIKYIRMLYQKYAIEFNNYNSVKITEEPPNRKIKYAVGYKSAKYCKLYEKYSGEETGLAMPLLPSLFPVTMPDNHCSKPLPLIVGGINASKGEFPHMAGLGYDRGEWIDFLCGGSLISDRFVLTAAHCGNTKWGPPIIVRLGTRNLITDDGHNMDVEKVIIHPDYKEPSSYNDIALIKLAEGPPLSRTLRPACLPSASTTAGDPGHYLTATGWGRTGYGLFSSPNLQKVPLEVMDNKTCEQMFLGGRRTERLPYGIASSMLCAAGYLDTSHDTCQGDSGGPLQAQTPHSKCMFEIVGITSFGKLCGTGLPAIYTRVSAYLPWIEDIVWPS